VSSSATFPNPFWRREQVHAIPKSRDQQESNQVGIASIPIGLVVAFSAWELIDSFQTAPILRQRLP